jgi:DNA-binding response OmpR family regulator
MKILLVEDDQELAGHLRQQLIRAGLAVDWAATKDDGYGQATTNVYDCLILDVTLPDGSGLDLCRQLRSEGVLFPVLMLTARGGIDDKLLGLELGADDYLAKPADHREVLARVRALIRRGQKKPSPILKAGQLTVDPASRRAWIGPTELQLSSKEFSVLEFLAYHGGEAVSRAMLMEHVWGSDFETFSNVIDVYIRSLRKKIAALDPQPYIQTLRGSGYRLADPS